MATLSTFQKFREEQEKKKQGGQQSTQQSTQQSGQKSTGLMNSYQQFMAKQQGQETAYTPESDYGQRVMDVIGKAGNSAAFRNGEWTADASGGNAAEINALLREYDAYTGDKSGMTEYRNALLDYNKRIQAENQYYAGFGTKDDFNRVRSGYTNFGVGYDPRSYGLDDASARKLRQESAQNDAKEAQRALAEYVAAKKAFTPVDQEYRIHNKGDSDGGAYSDEYEEDLNSRYNQARAKVTAAENALLNAQNRMNAYKAGWGKIDQYAKYADAAKNEDTSYTGASFDEIKDYEYKLENEPIHSDREALAPAEVQDKYLSGWLAQNPEPNMDDSLGLWLSMTEEQREHAKLSSFPTLQTLWNTANDGLWDALNDTEIQTYYYLRHNQGQEAALQYLKDLNPELNRRTDEAFIETVQNASTAGRWGYEAAAYGLNLIGNVEAGVGELGEMITGNHNPYSNTSRAQRYAGYIRGVNGQSVSKFVQDVAKNAGASDEFSAGAAKYAENTYQAITSGFDSAIGATVFGPAYLPIMGLGAMAQKSSDLELRGASNRQIAVGAVGAGCIEMLFEKVSLDHFFDNFIKTPPKSWKELIQKTLLQAGIEGSEEINTEIANIAFDAINMGKNCDVSMSIREYMAQGLSEEEAKKRATVDAVTDIYWAGFGGFVSGGAMAGASGTAKMGLSKAANAMGNYDVGKPLLENGRVADLQQQAESLTDAKKSAKLSKAAQEVAHNASAGDNSLLNTYKTGKVASQIAREAGREASRAEVTEFRNAAEKYLAGQRDIKNKKHALNVLTRAFEGTTTVPGDKAAMKNWGNKMTREILEGIGGKQTLQENAKARAASAIKTAVDVQSSVLGFEPTKGETAFEYNQEGDTQAYLKDSSDPVNIRAENPVAKIENGKMWLNTDDGQTVEADNVSFGTAEDASLASIVSRMNITADQANSLYAARTDSGMSAKSYATALQNAYLKGFSGVTYNGIQDYSAAAKLPGDVRRTAWEAGRQMRNRQTTQQAAKISKGTQMVNQRGLTFRDSAKSIKNLNEQQKTGIAAAKALAAAGLHIEVYASTETERANGAPNGIYRSSDGTIHIDLNAGDNGQGTVAYAVAHEATHFIKDLSADKYQIYADILIEAAESKGISYDSLLDRQLAKLSELAENRGKTAEELQELAYDETIAEMSETMLTDTDAAQRVSQELYKKDRTLWEKIRDFFTGLVEKLRSAYKGLDPDSDMGRVTRQAIRDNEKVAQAWAEALVEAGSHYSTGRDGFYEELQDFTELVEESSPVQAGELLQETQQVEEAETVQEETSVEAEQEETVPEAAQEETRAEEQTVEEAEEQEPEEIREEAGEQAPEARQEEQIPEQVVEQKPEEQAAETVQDTQEEAPQEQVPEEAAREELPEQAEEQAPEPQKQSLAESAADMVRYARAIVETVEERAEESEDLADSEQIDALNQARTELAIAASDVILNEGNTEKAQAAYEAAEDAIVDFQSLIEDFAGGRISAEEYEAKYAKYREQQDAESARLEERWNKALNDYEETTKAWEEAYKNTEEKLKAHEKAAERWYEAEKMALDAEDSLKKIEAHYRQKYGESFQALDGQKNNARGGERYSPRMTSDMTEQERYDKLKDLSLTVTASVNQDAISEAEAKYGTDIRDGVRLKSNDRKKLFQKIASIFGVTRDYRNQDIELEFGFSNENLSESLNKQKRYYYSYLKMLSCFENVVDSAIGIETHNRNEAGYKVDPTLKNMYVLVSAFQDGENITPVKLEIKEFSDKPNTLYVAIALDSIQSEKIGNKKSGIATEGNTVSGVTQSAPPLTISLADLFANVNPQDSSFLKYVPTQFLTEQQKSGEKYSSRTGDNIGGLQAELYQLKEQRKKLLEADPAYRAAQEQQRYANSFSERVSASKALKAAASNIDTSAIDSRITELQDRITEIRESKIRQHRGEQEKYSGTKTGGYSLEPDTRLKDLDADYSEAVKSGNRRKMQALVDRAAEAAMPKSVVRDKSGKLLKVYHYTNNDFTVFDRGMARTGNEMDGFFFAPDTESTREYGKRRIAAYLNITNLALDPVLDREFNDSGTLLREKLAAQGYDGVARTENGKIYEYMVFDSNQVKYADAVTYDDDGNVIPLSQRFDTGNEDIRYSSRNSGESQVDRLARKNEELKAEAEYLKQVVQIQKRGNTRNLRDRESVNAIAKSILESVNARDTEFGKRLNDFYRDLVTVEMDYGTMQEKAGELADRVLEHHQAELDGYAQEVLDFLKKRRVSLTESQIGDAEYTYGSLSEFKKAIKGSIIIDQNSTTSLDQLWQEAAARFPDQFSADITEADMPDGIANIVSWATNAEADSETEFQYYKAETRADLTQKILMGFLDAKPIESVSDTLKQQMADLKKQHQQEMRELRKSWDAEAKAMEQSHQYDLEAERKRGKAAVEALKYQQEVIQKAQKGLWETERADIKRSYEKQMKELREQNTQKAHEKVESRHRTEERHKLQNTVDTLNRMMLRPTNTSHVPQELQSSVAMAMKVINGVILDSKAGQNADRLAKYAEQLRTLEENPEANAEKIAALNKKIGNLTGRDISMKAALTSLQEQYAKLEGQDGGLYDSNIAALIADARETIGNTDYKDLSLDQLKAVRDTYTALLTTIRKANKAFVAGQNARIDDLVKRTTIELSMKGKKKPTQTAIGKKIDQFFWNNEKPVYAFERIGSTVMSELYRNLRNGEDTFYRDVNSARDFFLGAAEKNGFDKWNLDELQEFKASSGQKFQLSLDERMSLYAYSLRPQARDHLTKGGIVLAENTKRLQRGPLGVTMEVTYDDANAYTLTDETIDAIVGSLTKEQRQFAYEMQQYLAKVMGAKGDEVNMALYGIKKFGEETYWPLKSSGVFSERIREQQERTGNKVKNSGFTKALTQHANNAIELSSLTETWAEHVNDMSMYHAFTLPMEDFYRVYNWTQKGDTDGKRTMGVRQMIQQTAGKGAVTYIDQFLKDLNGGLRADPRETVSKAMLSGFKKAAVSASLSVAIQQPSAVGRALAYIEANYFVGSKVEGAGGVNATWEQLKKYAAVAGLKEMGRFDVDMGQSTLEYIIGRHSVNAWGKFTDKVDEFSGWLPEMADQVTWCGIWEAAKRKTAAMNPGLKGEALLQKAGELFTDTITRTQVYDSVFSRSANMRAKSGLMSMATAFMAEPTTTANMVEDAVRKFARGDKRMAGKVMSSVAVATVLNAALASVVYAARDDDEDKTYWEKYLASLAGETVDSFNPLTYIPVLADINNLLLGYSIERTDMSLASDLITALKKITTLYGKYDNEWSDEKKKEWEKKVRDAWLDNVWMAGTVMGLPLKNVVRDVEAVINTAKNPSNGAEMSADTVMKAMKDSARKNFPILSWKADESSSDQLYKAITQGKDVLARRMKAQFGGDKKYESALLKGLRENDPRIKEAAQYAIDGNTPKRVAIIREIVAEGHYTQDQVIKAINQKANSMKESSGGSSGDTPQKLYDYEEYVPAAANGLGYADEVRKELIRYQADRNQEKDEKLTRAEAEEAAEKTFKSKVKSETKDSYAAGELTEAQVRKVLTASGAVKDDELNDLILQWDTELELGDEISWSNARYLDYAETIHPAGISADTYDSYIRAVSKLSSIDEDGDGKTDITKQEQVIEYIDSMPISDAQKDALFQAEYPKARRSVLRKLPWR